MEKCGSSVIRVMRQVQALVSRSQPAALSVKSALSRAESFQEAPPHGAVLRAVGPGPALGQPSLCPRRTVSNL